MKDLEIRTKLKKGDNEKLLALEKECPMEGFVSIYYDHSPDFFKLYNLFGKLDPFFGEKNGRLIGFLGGAVIKVVVNGKPAKVLVGTNLKVRKEYRKKGIGYKLLRYGFNESIKKYDSVITFNMASNAPIEKMHKKFPEFVFNPLNVYQFLPFKKYKASGDYQISRAKKSDINEIASLIKSQLKNYFFHPFFSLQSFKKELVSLPNYKIKDILVAKKDGKIVACLGLWDQSPVRKIVVVDIPFKLKVLKQLLKALNLFFKVPQIPTLGKEIRVVYFRHSAYNPGFEGAFRDLVGHALNYCRKNNYLMAIAGASPTDPFNDLFKSFLKLRNKLYMGVYRKKLGISKKDLLKPVYVDASIL